LGATLAKLSKLTHLDLELTQPDPAELRDWCEKAQPSALEALNLGSAHLDRAVVEALVQAHPSLRSLDLSHTMSKVEELEPLEHAAALEELKLDSGINFNYAAGAGQLFARIPKLKKLCALSCGLKAVELEALAEHRGVTDLELTCSGPLDDGLEALAKMGQLERLAIGGSISSSSSQALAKHQRSWPGLTTLELSVFAQPDTLGEAIAGYTSVKHLSLSGRALGDDDLLAIGAMPRLESFSSASARHITPEGTEYLAARPTLKTIDFPYLTGADALLAPFADHPRLEEVSLEGSDLGTAGRSLLEKLPRIRVIKPGPGTAD
jgi:hypothetical protein